MPISKNHIKNKFEGQFNCLPAVILQAPGRINLIGEHTDYNGGLVMPAAVDKLMYFAFAKNNSSTSNIESLDYDQRFSIKNEEYSKSDIEWVNYLKGILLQFKNRGFELEGFDCMIKSNIPIGAGMSSSSALECGFAKGLDILFQCNLENWEIIDMSQKSNHEYLGIQGGILDQFSCFFGKEGNFMKMNCSSREFNYLPFDFDQCHLVLFNTNVKHHHLESGYNDRTQACKDALGMIQNDYPEVANLSVAKLQHLEPLKSARNLYNKAQFVIEENSRVLEMESAMTERAYQTMGEILLRSHKGLKELYEVSCEELDLMISLASNTRGFLGGRMMGGGFGGCTINLFENLELDSINSILKRYEESTNIKAEYYTLKLSEGVRILE